MQAFISFSRILRFNFSVIATPGRLLHVIVEMDFRLSAVQIIVFDEADRLFEMGFAEQLHVGFYHSLQKLHQPTIVYY